MNRPIIPIVIAVVLAAGAGLAVFLFASSSDSRAVADQQPVSIIVTNALIPAGTTVGDAIDQGLVESTQVPDKLAPAAAMQSLDSANLSDVAVADLPAGQVVLDGSFARELPDVTPLQVPEGQMAVSVLLEDPAKVGQFLRPGSRIAIFDTAKLPPADGVTEPVIQTRPILGGIEVLAIGPTTEQQAEGATDEAWQATLVTVAVDQGQAEKLIHGIQAGVLYLALLGDNTSLESSAGVNNVSLFN